MLILDFQILLAFCVFLSLNLLKMLSVFLVGIAIFVNYQAYQEIVIFANYQTYHLISNFVSLTLFVLFFPPNSSKS